MRSSERISFFDLLPRSQHMLDEVRAGLAKPQKEISPKFFYDARGCELFEAICGLPEYSRRYSHGTWNALTLSRQNTTHR